MKWACVLWMILKIMAPVQHVLAIKIVSSSADFKYQIIYVNGSFDHSKSLQN